MKTSSLSSANNKEQKLLFLLFEKASTPAQTRRLFSALFTPAEIQTFAERVGIVQGLLLKKTQRSLSKEIGASLATISRGSKELQFGDGIFQELFTLLDEEKEEK